MLSLAEAPVKDAAELQRVLTRYIDSFDGYTQAAEVADSPHLSDAFREIAERRQIVVRNVSGLIIKQGEKPDQEGSPEAAIHRWWIRVRAQMSSEELGTLLEECVRGEKELARVAEDILRHGNLDPTHSGLLSKMVAEVHEAIRSFEAALHR